MNSTKKCPFCHEEIKAEALKCRYCRSNLTMGEHGSGWVRDYPDRRLLGVASMMARTTGLPVNIIRIIFVVLGLFRGFGLLVYLAIWLVTPPSLNEKSAWEKCFCWRPLKNFFTSRIETPPSETKNNDNS